MLGKLLKHEFKAVNRLMIPLHLALILITIAGRLYIQFAAFSETGKDLTNTNPWFIIMSSSLAGMYIVALIAVSIVTHLYLQILRPRKNLFTDEGYLTHTLPVTASSHIWSKLIVAFVWSILDAVLILISVLAMFINKEILRDFSTEWQILMSHFPNAFGVSAGLGIPLFLVVTILDTVAGILIIYMCMAIGHSFNNHKILASVGIYAGYNVVGSLISSIFVGIAGNSIFGTTMTIISSSYIERNASYFWGIMIFSIAFSLVLSVVAFVVTNYFLRKRLNLE